MNGYGECLYKGKWIQKQIEINQLPPGGGSDSIQYLRSFYWSVSTLICVVIGEIGPINMIETLYLVISILVGVLINSGIIGEIAGLVANLEGEEAVFSSKMEELDTYLVSNRIPELLSLKITRYMEYIRESKGGFNDHEILSDLPETLHSIVQQLQGYNFILSSPIFQTMDRSFIREIALELEPIVFSPAELIYSLGDNIKEMYFIIRGRISLFDTNEGLAANQATLTLYPGNYFGELCTFCSVPTTEYSKSVDFSESLTLRQDKLCNLLELFTPDLDKLFKNIINGNKDGKGAKSARQRMTIKSMAFDTTLIDEDVFIENTLHFPPYNLYRKIWETVGFFGTIYYAVTIPFFIGFHDPDTLKTSNSYVTYIVLDLLFLIYYMTDIILKMNFFSFLNEGVLETKRIFIRKHYLHSNFAFDILACFPYEFFAVVSIRKYPFLRIPHFILLIRYGDYYSKLQTLLTTISKKIKPVFINIINISFLLLIFVHFCSCFEFIIHRYFIQDAPLDWLIVDGLSTFNYTTGRNNVINDDVEFLDVYVRAVYYTMNVICTIGYGDIQPYTPTEIIFNLFMEIIGASFQAALIGTISAFFIKFDATGEVLFRENINNIKEFMKFRQLPETLTNSILFYYTKLWDKQNKCSIPSAINDLSTQLQKELYYDIYGSKIKHIDDLYTLPQKAQECIVLYLKPFICDYNEYIYRIGDFADDIYFIVLGTVTLNNSMDFNEDKETGESFGHEEFSIGINTRKNYARASTYCDLLRISHSSLVELLTLFPEISGSDFFGPFSKYIPNFEYLLDPRREKPNEEITSIDYLRELYYKHTTIENMYSRKGNKNKYNMKDDASSYYGSFMEKTGGNEKQSYKKEHPNIVKGILKTGGVGATSSNGLVRKISDRAQPKNKLPSLLISGSIENGKKDKVGSPMGLGISNKSMKNLVKNPFINGSNQKYMDSLLNKEIGSSRLRVESYDNQNAIEKRKKTRKTIDTPFTISMLDDDLIEDATEEMKQFTENLLLSEGINKAADSYLEKKKNLAILESRKRYIKDKASICIDSDENELEIFIDLAIKESVAFVLDRFIDYQLYPFSIVKPLRNSVNITFGAKTINKPLPPTPMPQANSFKSKRLSIGTTESNATLNTLNPILLYKPNVRTLYNNPLNQLAKRGNPTELPGIYQYSKVNDSNGFSDEEVFTFDESILDSYFR